MKNYILIIVIIKHGKQEHRENINNHHANLAREADSITGPERIKKEWIFDFF